MAFSTNFTQKSGVFFTDLARKIGVFGVNFILQKFCPCKKNDKYQVWLKPHDRWIGDLSWLLLSNLQHFAGGPLGQASSYDGS